MLAVEFPEWPADKIQSKLGISSRFVSALDETALDLATEACRELLKTELKEEIDFLLLCTQSPDYFLPTTACILQNRLELSRDIGAYDFNLGCSGYIYGLAQAKGLLNTGIAQKILLVTAETYTRHLNSRDRGNRTIFGDAATASLITNDNCKIGNFVLGTDGAGAENLIIRNGGMRTRYTPDAPMQTYSSGQATDNDLFMNGSEILNFTMDIIPRLVKKTLLKNNLTMDEIDYVVFHQANTFILNSLRKIMRIPENKFIIDLAESGNTVSSTIPIALKHMLDDNRLTPGTRLLLCGFGVGYSYGATVLTM